MQVRKIRLDLLLVERGLAESRSLSQRLIMAGQVRVNGEVTLRAAANVPSDAHLEVEHGPRFVSRGGEKLEAALKAFEVDVADRTCADVGSSTGGFTDCLLQHGAARVYAIDVGHGILDWKLRRNPRVVVMESTNARYVKSLPEAIELITMDVSFISLKILLPVVRAWLIKADDDDQSPKGSVVALIKPQFEAGRQQVSRNKGVIRDPLIHHQVLLDILGYAQETGYAVLGLSRSPITGPKGNVEFLAWLEGSGAQSVSIAALADLAALGKVAESEPSAGSSDR
jgi:23S rRNA (cytidine1920-2'-O)/16S rRNA (cytidine1409-2'-O)-methyltransferase